MSVKRSRLEYAELFDGESRIEALKIPPLADEYLDYANEIKAAYFRFHTFRFKIYLNYDVAAGWFYTDARRWNDCGKLTTGPKSLAKLRAAGAHEGIYSNVVLEICTHFRTIACITVEVRRSKLNVGPVVDTFVDNKLRNEEKHAKLNNFVNRTAMAIQDLHQDFTNGKNGLNFSDLEEVALCFQVLPSDEENYQRSFRDYKGAWSNRWRNPGFLKELEEYSTQDQDQSKEIMSI